MKSNIFMRNIKLVVVLMVVIPMCYVIFVDSTGGKVFVIVECTDSDLCNNNDVERWTDVANSLLDGIKKAKFNPKMQFELIENTLTLDIIRVDQTSFVKRLYNRLRWSFRGVNIAKINLSRENSKVIANMTLRRVDHDEEVVVIEGEDVYSVYASLVDQLLVSFFPIKFSIYLIETEFQKLASNKDSAVKFAYNNCILQMTNKDAAAILCILGDRLEKERMFDSANEKFTAALNYDRDNVIVLHYAGTCLVMEALTSGGFNEPDGGGACQNLGIRKLELKQPVGGACPKQYIDKCLQASKYFERILDIDQTYISALVADVSVLTYLGRYNDCVSVYERILGGVEKDSFPTTQVQIARALVNVGRTDEALRVYKHLHELVPGDVNIADEYSGLMSKTENAK